MRRHTHMSSHGILVLHFTPRQIRTDPRRVIAAITDTLAAGAVRPVLPLTARQAAA
jgi:very-short-patch-repair endonuclease